MNYTSNLSKQIGNEIAKLWNTNILEMEESMIGGAMINIRLPISNNINFWQNKVLPLMQNKYSTFLAFFEFDGICYVRMSAQIYNDLDSYLEVGKILYEEAKKLNNI